MAEEKDEQFKHICLFLFCHVHIPDTHEGLLVSLKYKSDEGTALPAMVVMVNQISDTHLRGRTHTTLLMYMYNI